MWTVPVLCTVERARKGKTHVRDIFQTGPTRCLFYILHAILHRQGGDHKLAYASEGALLSSFFAYYSARRVFLEMFRGEWLEHLHERSSGARPLFLSRSLSRFSTELKSFPTIGCTAWVLKRAGPEISFGSIHGGINTFLELRGGIVGGRTYTP